MVTEQIKILAELSMTLATPVIGFIGIVITTKIKNVKDNLTNLDKRNTIEHEKTKQKVDHLASLLSYPEMIKNTIRNAEEFANENDGRLLKFTKSCGDAFIYLYEELTSKNPKHVTHEELSRATTRILVQIQSASGHFEKEFINIFWAEFQNEIINYGSVSPKGPLLEIIEDEFNDKKGRIGRDIERFLFKQLKYVILNRNNYLNKKQ